VGDGGNANYDSFPLREKEVRGMRARGNGEKAILHTTGQATGQGATLTLDDG
jgi:hypothetical protein